MNIDPVPMNRAIFVWKKGTHIPLFHWAFPFSVTWLLVRVTLIAYVCYAVRMDGYDRYHPRYGDVLVLRWRSVRLVNMDEHGSAYSCLV